MLSLDQYFKPLSPLLILSTILILLFFDILGFYINRIFIKSPKYLRTSIWLFGLAIFSFVWFILHFFIPFRAISILISATILLIPSLPIYMKSKGLKSLFFTIKSHPWPLIIIGPLLPIVFVKSSLPPYYFDEMAYHYLSPKGLQDFINWGFSPGGLYQNLPRSLNTIYYLIFGLFKTYSPSRLIHFSIMFSLFYSISLWLRSKVGFLSSIVFLALYFYLPQDLITPSTLGYIDIAAVTITSLAAVTLIDFILTKKKSVFLSSIALWSVALGIKYNTAIPFMAYIVVLSNSILFMKYRLKIINKKFISRSLWLFIFLGGFWYLKNLYLFHNPIYPFLFPCKQGLAEICPASSSFFAGWTQPINLKELPSIFNALMVGQKYLAALFVANIILLPFQKNKKLKIIIISILAATSIEFLVMKYLSGFYIRYFQHVQILLLLTTVIQLPSLKVKHTFKSPFIIYGLCLGLFILITGYKTLRYYYYQSSYIQAYEVQYARRKFSLDDWITLKFPRMKNFIYLCSSPPGNVDYEYAWIDPDLIWFEYDGMSRVFMTNCTNIGAPLNGVPVGQVVKYARENNIVFNFPSVNPCVEPDKIRTLGYENENQIYLRQLNNEIVCHSKETAPYVYSFDYRNL